MNSQKPLSELIKLVKEILKTKYPSAELAFLAGSIVRGEGTRFSDLDIVIIFDELANAYRESFYFQELPVETFVHTPETLNCFFELDRKDGVPSLARMVSEGVVIEQSGSSAETSERLKRLANKSLADVPHLSNEETDNLRYQITNLTDDIREPRSKEELIASGTTLYSVLAKFYLRTNGCWAARDKSIPRSLKKTNPDFCRQFIESFEELFTFGKPEKVISLSKNMLEKHGGFLFEGVRLDAPKEWKKIIE